MWDWLWDWLLEIVIDVVVEGIKKFLKWIIKVLWIVFIDLISLPVKWFWTNQIVFRKFPPNSPLGREKEMKQLIEKIRIGQSGAIIGFFDLETRELLENLREKSLYGRKAKHLLFSPRINIANLPANCTANQFWKIALRPLGEIAQNVSMINDNNEAMVAYLECQNKNFSSDCLDKLFKELKQADLRLILPLDRVDKILPQPNLIQETFLTKLRYLSIRYSSLCLVVTAHESLKKLYQEIIKIQGPMSNSPFFNHLEVGEITLGALSESEQNKLLRKLKLSKQARQFIKHEVGRHPYLLKIVIDHLKKAEQIKGTNPVEITRQYFHQQCEALLNEMLSTCPTIYQVFVQIAQGIFSNSDKYTKVLEELEKMGLIKWENEQWQVFSPVFFELLKKKAVSKPCSKI